MVDAGNGTAKWVRIACALALLFIGFAHTPPAAGAHAASPALLLQYAFPDGTLPVLCLSGDEEPGSHGPGGGCEACRLAAGILLPAPAGAASWLLPRCGDAMPPRIEAFSRHLFPPSASPRAPPSGPAA